MTFNELASQAKQQEQLRRYGHAAKAWTEANRVARKKENKEWSGLRALFCTHLHETRNKRRASA